MAVNWADYVQGNIAAGATDVGNPVGVGGTDTRITAAPPSPAVAGTRGMMLQDLYGAVYTRKIGASTYHAIYRAAARPYSLTNIFGAAGRKQFATIHHTAGATKLVRIQEIWVWMINVSAAFPISVDLFFINTAPATGNPVITAQPAARALGNSEAVCLALPTTAGTEVGNPLGTYLWNTGITGGGSVINPPPAVDKRLLYKYADEGSGLEIILQTATLEGLAITVDINGAATVLMNAEIIFTEETY